MKLFVYKNRLNLKLVIFLLVSLAILGMFSFSHFIKDSSSNSFTSGLLMSFIILSVFFIDKHAKTCKSLSNYNPNTLKQNIEFQALLSLSNQIIIKPFLKTKEFKQFSKTPSFSHGKVQTKYLLKLSHKIINQINQLDLETHIIKSLPLLEKIYHHEYILTNKEILTNLRVLLDISYISSKQGLLTNYPRQSQQFVFN